MVRWSVPAFRLRPAGGDPTAPGGRPLQLCHTCYEEKTLPPLREMSGRGQVARWTCPREDVSTTDTQVLSRGGRGVRSPTDALMQGRTPRSYNGTMPVCIVRRPCAVDILDKPSKSDENRTIDPSLAEAGYTGQYTH